MTMGRMGMNKALFLDRDGIINVDKGYVYRIEDIVWIEETFKMIKVANERNYRVIVVTNQSGIAHGYYSQSDVELLHKQMDAVLLKKNLILTDWFHCPSLDSLDRKPSPGMILKAQKKYNLDLGASFMVGDKISDVFETDGTFVRPTTLLVQGSYDLKNAAELENVTVYPDHKSIREALEKKMLQEIV